MGGRMNVAQAVAHALKEEGVEYLFTYPINPIIEAAAAVDIRPIPVRQERVGLHMADAFSRTTAGEEIVPAIERGIEQTEAGTPALLEFITAREIEYPEM